jgi:hypothetical protein
MKRSAVRTLEPQSIPLLALPFVPFPEYKRLPRLAAIYFVLNSTGTVLYVGQSINLALRWAGHHRTAKLIDHQATRIAWLVMDDTTLLDAVEAACIIYFDPPCNGFRGIRAPQQRSRCAGLKRLPKRNDYQKRLIRIPMDMYLWLEEDAFQHGHTMNFHILYLIEKRMQKEGYAFMCGPATLATV